MKKRNKIFAVTSGDPAGIGPEIIGKCLDKLNPEFTSKLIVIGRKRDYKRLNNDFEISWFNELTDCTNFLKTDNLAGLYQPDLENLLIKTGRPTKESGKIALNTIETAVELCNLNITDGIVTAPISKEALKLAGYEFTGHTTIFKTMTNTEPVMTFFTPFGQELFKEMVLTSLVTMHIPYSQVSETLSSEKIEYVIRQTHEALIKYFGILTPRIAVSGLNPHAGESGMFGREELDIINPVIKNLQDEGINVVGAIPPDTIFHRAFNKHEFEAVVAMFHDQGLIAVKTLNFQNSVQLTLGLPFIRTSVDHGTAYDIAGRGIADYKSMLNALILADCIY